MLSIIDSLVRTRESSRDPNDERWWSSYVPTMTSSGEAVTEESALSVSAVFACVRVIAEDVAKLPLKTYRRLPNGGKEPATDEPEYNLLHVQPNTDTTSFNFRQAVTVTGVLYGNGYAVIKRKQSGKTIALEQIEPWRVTPKRDNRGKLYYEIENKPGEDFTRVPAANMIHLTGFSRNGIVGDMMARLGGDTIGLSQAAERFASEFFANGSTPNVAIMVPKPLNAGQAQKLRESWNAKHGGAGNRHGAAVLDNGADLKTYSTDPDKSQLVETRYFQVEEVARWFRVAPHKIQHLLRSTFSNIEQQSIEHVSDTLMPWLVRWEQELTRKLFLPRTDDLFAEHLVDALLRGEALNRAQALQMQFQNGALTIDEWREIENRNPLGAEAGKRHYVMANMTPVERAGQDESQPVRARPGAFAPIFREAAERLGRKEAKAVSQAVAKYNGGRLQQWLRDFYRAHESQVIEALLVPGFALSAACDLSSVDTANTIRGWVHGKLTEHETQAVNIRDDDEWQRTAWGDPACNDLLLRLVEGDQ